MLNLIYFCTHHGRHVNDSNTSQSLEFTLLDHLPTSDGYPPHYLSICRLRATPHSVSIYIGLFTLHYIEDSSNLTTTKKTERIQAEIYSRISNLDACLPMFSSRNGFDPCFLDAIFYDFSSTHWIQTCLAFVRDHRFPSVLDGLHSGCSSSEALP